VRRALLPLFMLFIGLAACGGPDPRAPFTDSRIPPGLEHRFHPPQGWAWGLLKVGEAPTIRYGVSAPGSAPRAQVLILTGFGEPAETWFETVRDLNSHGYAVWVMEPAGQGGSGRYSSIRDLGHAKSLDPDVGALLAFPARVARAGPLFVVASGTSAPVAVRAATLGLKAQGLVLSAPVFDAGPADQLEKARRMRRFGLGALRATGGVAWKREGPDDQALGLTHDGVRGKVRLAWQIANPDLRMGGPSWAWRAALADESAAARLAEPKVPMATLVLGGEPKPGSRPCGRIRNCVSVRIPNVGAAPQLGDDGVRNPWLAAIVGFIEPSGAGVAPAPPTGTVDPEG